MSEKEYESKTIKPVIKSPPIYSRILTIEQLNMMKTDELIKLLLSPQLAQSANAPLRQQIIKILQQREGNAFVQRLLGKATGGK